MGTAGKIAVFGVPTAAGARGAGTSRAPLALREAGLLTALRALGPRVVHLSDLSLFPYREDPEHPRRRNAEVVACAARAAADEMTRALAEGFTVVLGGDCTLVAGTVAGARQALGRPVGLVYLDANADLNTEETTPSGFLCGMALALAMGHGPAEVAAAGGPPPAVSPEHVALIGFRDVDPGERSLLGTLALALPAAETKALGMPAAAARALAAVANGGRPVFVHFDVDVIDPRQMPAKGAVTEGEGLSLAEATELLGELVAAPRVVALEVCELDVDHDPDGRHARAIVDVVAGALARRFLASRPPP
jgi:arginase